MTTRRLIENDDLFVGKPDRRGARPRHEVLADAISSIDSVIATQTQKLALLQQHKRGLQQQLAKETGQ